MKKKTLQDSQNEFISKEVYKAKSEYEFDIKKGDILQNQYDEVKCKVLGVYENICFIIYHDKASLIGEFGTKKEVRGIYQHIDVLKIDEGTGSNNFFEIWEKVEVRRKK